MPVSPQTLTDESERIARLRELLVLDTAPEPMFDTIARLASEACCVPVSLMTLVDGERQWFKANVGLPGINETPRDIAFCAHTIAEDGVLVVPDATLDPRFADNPLVTGTPQIRFYAGAPLILPDGARVGTLCVIDRQARQLSATQAQMLRVLATVASQALVMRRDLITSALSVHSGYEQALGDNERFVRLIADSLPVTIAYADKLKRYQFVNLALCKRFGRPRAEILGRTRSELTQGASDEVVGPRIEGVLAGQAQRFEFEQLVDGALRQIETQLIPDFSADGEVRGYFASGIDITERSAAERALRNAQQQLQRHAATLRSVTEAIPANIAVVGADERFRFVNSGFERWLGSRRDAIVGRTMREVLGAEEYERSRPWVKRVLTGETVNFEKDFSAHGGARHLAVSYIPLWLENGGVDGFIGVAQDISQHKEEESRLLQLIQRDALTGLLNRAGFEGYMERRFQEGSGASLALLYIDLDHFKSINDRHGHPAGDQLLQQFAQRLRDLVRPTDAVARLGGDEFAVVLSGVRAAKDAHTIGEKVIAAARIPFEIESMRLAMSASVGVAFGADPAAGWPDLIRRADAMLYRAKDGGRGRQAG